MECHCSMRQMIVKNLKVSFFIIEMMNGEGKEDINFCFSYGRLSVD